MDIAGKGGHIMVTWDVWVHSGLGGMSSRDGRFSGSGSFPISSGGVALGKMGGGLATGIM